MIEQDLFVEQAEYIESDAFLKWHNDHPDEDSIIRKLSHGGAKLITGPRGCGKTTLILKTFYKLCSERKASALPIYVNFKSSLKLEPLYKDNANAVFWFNQWILFKVYKGLYETLKQMKVELSINLQLTEQVIDKIISQLELGRTDISIAESELLSIPLLESDINAILSSLNKTRCVLLLDDAAHAFSPEQQRDFFDFFRQIKSKVISPKAAIYPGVTTYSSTFHVGHDAEEIDVWIKPDSDDYINFMFGLLKRRLPEDVYNALQSNVELLQLVCYAAFGMPRALLNMIRNFYKESLVDDEILYRVNFKRKKALGSIKSTFESTLNVYSSLKVKLPIYEKFITEGEQLFEKIINTVKVFNRGKRVNQQTTTIAIRKPLPAELSKVLGFFQYVGLLLPKGVMSRGTSGTFELYSTHYAALIERNALLVRTAVNISDYSSALRKLPPKLYPRITPNVLMGTDDSSSLFQLSLPPCQVCKTPRINEQAKFCLNCGAQLKTVSTFERLITQKINQLPLTDTRIRAIKQNSRIREIKDILMDHENKELRGVPQIGPYWAHRIYSYAEEYIV